MKNIFKEKEYFSDFINKVKSSKLLDFSFFRKVEKNIPQEINLDLFSKQDAMKKLDLNMHLMAVLNHIKKEGGLDNYVYNRVINEISDTSFRGFSSIAYSQYRLNVNNIRNKEITKKDLLDRLEDLVKTLKETKDEKDPIKDFEIIFSCVGLLYGLYSYSTKPIPKEK